jgi:hypothetical protein
MEPAWIPESVPDTRKLTFGPVVKSSMMSCAVEIDGHTTPNVMHSKIRVRMETPPLFQKACLPTRVFRAALTETLLP